MIKYRFKYEYVVEFGNPRHTWSAIGRHGAMHLHITDLRPMNEKLAKPDNLRIDFSGGIETHWRIPPTYMEDQAPSQDRCWLLNCPCWHDGSSMRVSDYWIPRWREAPNDHDRMFDLLSEAMDKEFAAQIEGTTP